MKIEVDEAKWGSGIYNAMIGAIFEYFWLWAQRKREMSGSWLGKSYYTALLFLSHVALGLFVLYFVLIFWIIHIGTLCLLGFLGVLSAISSVGLLLLLLFELVYFQPDFTGNLSVITEVSQWVGMNPYRVLGVSLLTGLGSVVLLLLCRMKFRWLRKS